jgi:hypothetical protein
MELLAVGLWGYKRFEDDHGNLDVAGNPIAVVGPNEVGKTTFLRALLYLNEEGGFAANEFTRRGNGQICVRAVFALSDDDRALIPAGSGSTTPSVFTAWKREGGQLATKLEPPIERDRAPRQKVRGALGRLRSSTWSRSLGADDALAQAIAELHGKLDDDEERLGDEITALIQTTAALIEEREDASASAKQLAKTLPDLARHESAQHPDDAARAILLARRPVFLWFDDDRRMIESEHNVNDQPSAALANLLALINFDLPGLGEAIRRNDRATVAEMVNEANTAFSRLFEGRWRQARVRVELDTDGELLHLFVTNTAGRLVPIAERSDGLRQFIALLAFVEQEAAGQEAIVLVDEAEQHLHYDAQADLVRVFSGQTAAQKIIYTTHSAGCLPHDLGTGVRVLEPVGPDDVPAGEWDRSKVQNWFWTKAPGFSPLLMAMGATTFAFAGARKAVVAEGISDVLLLPTLFREASGREVIAFQIAPGLSNVGENTFAELDLVAARVAYLVDGDEAGLAKRQQLLDANVPTERIFVLGQRSKLTLEDVLKKDIYLSAVNKELSLRHGVEIPSSAVPNIGRKKAVENWCERAHDAAGNTVEPPSERAVAHHLFLLQRDARLNGKPLDLLDPKRQPMLAKLHDQIDALLERPSYAVSSRVGRRPG